MWILNSENRPASNRQNYDRPCLTLTELKIKNQKLVYMMKVEEVDFGEIARVRDCSHDHEAQVRKDPKPNGR